jgi:hypothetical protein
LQCFRKALQLLGLSCSAHSGTCHAVRELLVCLERLLWLGMVLLTVGVLAGILMPHHGEDAWKHVFAAIGVWTGYVTLMGTKRVRGLTGRRFSLGAVLLFVLSLGVFAFV